MPSLRFLTLVVALAFPLLPSFAQTGSFRQIAVKDATPLPPAIVVGFVGGFVHHDNTAHTTVQLAAHLREEYSSSVYAQAYENHRQNKALSEVLRHLDLDHDGHLTLEEKQNARVIIFGHSWGGSEAVTLARKLEGLGVPVLLTIQVDSVAKPGENDGIIPPNVEQAANFFQPDGIIHGRSVIQAADPTRTEIIGNFRFNYKENPVSCSDREPWLGRVFMKTHLAIECDSTVWSKIESLIASKVSP